jgi:hypothetical protein
MEDETILKNAQYRKSLAIAYFNATNAAIELCKGLNIHEKETKIKIIEYRNWFLEEHKKYYAENIANVGKPYDSKETIEKLKIGKTLEEVKQIWLSLSADERADGDIIKVAQELKKQLTK